MHEDDHQLVVVVVNPTDQARYVGIVTGFGALGMPEVMRTSPTENAASVSPTLPDMLGPQILYMPAQSVATFVWVLP